MMLNDSQEIKDLKRGMITALHKEVINKLEALTDKAVDDSLRTTYMHIDDAILSLRQSLDLELEEEDDDQLPDGKYEEFVKNPPSASELLDDPSLDPRFGNDKAGKMSKEAGL